MRKLCLAIGLTAVRLSAQEPAARPLTPSAIPRGTEMTTISGVRELRDGRLLLSDAKRPGLFIADPHTGAATLLGTIGGGANEYAQPGGFYSAAGDSVFLLDRGLGKVLVISP